MVASKSDDQTMVGTAAAVAATDVDVVVVNNTETTDQTMVGTAAAVAATDADVVVVNNTQTTECYLTTGRVEEEESSPPPRQKEDSGCMVEQGEDDNNNDSSLPSMQHSVDDHDNDDSADNSNLTLAVLITSATGVVVKDGDQEHNERIRNSNPEQVQMVRKEGSTLELTTRTVVDSSEPSPLSSSPKEKLLAMVAGDDSGVVENTEPCPAEKKESSTSIAAVVRQEPGPQHDDDDDVVLLSPVKQHGQAPTTGKSPTVTATTTTTTQMPSNSGSGSSGLLPPPPPPPRLIRNAHIPSPPGAFRVSGRLGNDALVVEEDVATTSQGSGDYDISRNSSDNDDPLLVVTVTATIVDEEQERRTMERLHILDRLEQSASSSSSPPPLLFMNSNSGGSESEAPTTTSTTAIQQSQSPLLVRAEPVLAETTTNRRKRSTGKSLDVVLTVVTVIVALVSLLAAMMVMTTNQRGRTKSVDTSPTRQDNIARPGYPLTKAQVEANVGFANKISLSGRNVSFPITTTDPGAVTPEEQALEWFILNGEVLTDNGIPNATQRFAVVVLAYALQPPQWVLSKNFDECKLAGVQCEYRYFKFKTIKRVNHLSMDGAGLPGSIPTNIALLTDLATIQLWNNSLIGTVPWNHMMGRMTALSKLDVGRNQLSGALPVPTPGTWPFLQVFSLVENQFQGSIAQDFIHWPNLTDLALGSNQLSGNIPSALGQIPNLSILDVGENPNMTGTIPTELGRLPMVEFNCGGNNHNGTLPTEIEHWVNVSIFNVSDNALTGSIPSGIGNWTSIQIFNVQNNELLAGHYHPVLHNGRD